MPSTQFAPSIPTKRLVSPILSTDMSFSLNSYTGWDGVALSVSDLPTYPRGVFRSPDNTRIEFFTFDPATITGPITILARGLDYKGGTTDGQKTKYDWPAGTLVELGSNPPAEQEDYVDKISNETIAGVKTFSSSPVVPTGGTGTQAANATDIANAVTGASGLATASVYGTVKMSTAPVSPTAPIAVGQNDPKVPPVDVSTLTAGMVAALAGNSGTAPSVSNKFVDAADADTAATASKIVRRIAGGQITVAATPSATTDASSKSYVDAAILKNIVSTASNTLRDSADTERGSYGYTNPMKSIRVQVQGIIRVKFDMKTSSNQTVTGQVYKNGAAFGSAQTTNNPAYTTYSEDLGRVEPGDLIQLYVTDGASSNYPICRNFRIYYDNAEVADAVVTD